MRNIDLSTVHLSGGIHTIKKPGQWCLLEAVSYIAGEPWSDRPKCVSPVLATYGRVINDTLPDDLRQELVPFIPSMIGTAGDGLDRERGYVALDWLTRVYAPAWMRLVPALVPQADLLAGSRPITSLDASWEIVDVVNEAASQSAAAQASAEASWCDMRQSGAQAAWRASYCSGVTWDIRAAAWATARSAGVAAQIPIAPTFKKLQQSAIKLMFRMINPYFGHQPIGVYSYPSGQRL